MWALLAIAFYLTSFAHGIDIVVSSRDPFCNPVPENSVVHLKVLLTETWQVCIWSREQSMDSNNGPIVCNQYPIHDADNTVVCNDNRYSHLTGGEYNDKRCELVIHDVDYTDNGFWHVKVFHNISLDQETVGYTFEVVSNQAAQVDLDYGDSFVNNSISIDQGVVQEVTCVAQHGVPHPTTFNWTIDSATYVSFHNDWQAFLYPLDPAGSNVTQRLQFTAPTSGTFQVQCLAYQGGIYSSSKTIVLHVSGGNGDSTDSGLKWNRDWTIVVAVVGSVLVLVILLCIIAYCTGWLCFGKGKKDSKSQKPQRHQQQNDMKTGRELSASALRREQVDQRTPNNDYRTSQDYRTSAFESVQRSGQPYVVRERQQLNNSRYSNEEDSTYNNVGLRRNYYSEPPPPDVTTRPHQPIPVYGQVNKRAPPPVSNHSLYDAPHGINSRYSQNSISAKEDDGVLV